MSHSETLYDPKLPIYLEFDFNVNNSVAVLQRKNGERSLIETYHLNVTDLKEICRQIALKYGKNFLHVTGDTSSNAGATNPTGNQSSWSLIRIYLSEFGAYFVDYSAVLFNNLGRPYKHP